MMRLVLAATLALAAPAVAQPVDPGARALFLQGEGAEVRLSSGSVSLPAAAFPCANCHGIDAMGGREGTTQIPPIRWSDLARPTADRPAYDAETLIRAVAEGVDPSGRALDAVMPRYQIPAPVLAALPGFLATLEAEQQAGIGPAALDLIAPADTSAAAGFRAALADFGKTGAAHGRKLRIVAADQPSLHDFRDSEDLAGRVRRAEIDALMNAAAGAGEAALVPIGIAPGDIAGISEPELNPGGSALLLAGPGEIEPGRRAIYARRDALTMPLIAALNQADTVPHLVVTDPFPAAADWARRGREGPAAAWGYALGLMAVEAAVLTGRATSHARFDAALRSVAERPVEIREVKALAPAAP